MMQRSAINRRSYEPWLYLAPVLIGLTVFTVGPVLASTYLSFTRWDIPSPPVWIGLDNYRDLVQSPLFWQVMRNTAYYVMLYVPLSTAVALLLALLVHRKFAGAGFFRAVFFLPVVTSMVAAALIFGWMFNSDIGLINFFLSKLGIAGPRWLEDPNWTMPSLVIVGIWKNAGYSMMIFLAGLANVPHDLHEAARLDGASSIRRFFRITLPLLSPVLFFIVVVTTISAFQVFEQTYVLMHGGGPANSTLTLSYFIWQTAFSFLHPGSASAMAYILFVVLGLLTLVQFIVRKRWVYVQ